MRAEIHSLITTVPSIRRRMTVTWLHANVLSDACLQHEADSSRPHETQDAALADIDVPPEHRNPPECRHDLRNDAIAEHLQREMRFVTPKTSDQQARAALFRSRTTAQTRSNANQCAAASRLRFTAAAVRKA